MQATTADVTAHPAPPEPRRQTMARLMTVVMAAIYLIFGNVWSLADVWPVVAGILWVWLPAWLFLYGLMRDECQDGIEAGTLSAVGSLGLTTFLSFAAHTLAIWQPTFLHAETVVRLAWLVTGTAMIVKRARRNRVGLQNGLRIDVDWTLVALILASLCATARFQRISEPAAKQGEFRYLLDGDQTYFTALSHELIRSNPPRTCAIRAGIPERAYHNFPHLMLALMAGPSGTTDLLRVHLVADYSILCVLCCCVTFCLARELGGDRAAGLLAVWLLFLGAIPLPKWSPEAFFAFYSSLWPQASSSIEPVLMTSPQAYCGVTVALGCLCGLLRVYRRVQQGLDCTWTVMLVAFLAATLLRFRAHAFIVLAPIIFLAIFILGVRFCRWKFLWALVCGAAVIAVFLAEMRLPIYMQGSQQIRLGNNQIGLNSEFINGWPGSHLAKRLLYRFVDSWVIQSWVWQYVTLTAFCVFNILGPPLLAAVSFLVGMWWLSKRDRGLALFVLAIFAGTLLASSLLSLQYDSYSLGGQIPLHLGWYLFPCLPVAVWRLLATRIASRVTPRWKLLAWVLTLTVVGWQLVRPAGPTELAIRRERSFEFTAEEAEVWTYIRQQLPAEAVLLTNLLRPNTAVWPGIAGRRTYLDYIPADAFDSLLAEEDRLTFRQRRIEEIYSQTDEAQLTRQMPSMVSHVVEFSSRPLRIHPPGLLRLVWQSSHGEVRIWEVMR